MALTWMRHEVHGVIDVYDDATIELNKKNGWEVFDRTAKAPATPVVPAAKEPEAVEDWLNGEAPAVKRGPGRPRKDA